ncbi:UDP-4-amino-4,6-dideoxy-N-acetyl-beta-L-altrosamine N-acetyltransferase [Pararhodospirillum photometricum]|nr:UDP-4-amino-4,6-dideoxy-N-acetyl-beta-L-altrosamine N-acetyltransferase [Pararhodospirillum photometricum]
MLRSNRLLLRAIEESDLPIISFWRSQPEVYEYFYEYLPISVRQQKNWYEKQLQDSSEINFVVADIKTGKAIGTVSIYHIDRRSRKAEWGRLIIGDPSARSGGKGAEIEALVLQYSFEHLNLNKLYCEVLLQNEKVVSLHKKFGFHHEGVLRQHAFKAGKYEDVVMLSMLAEEYFFNKDKGKLAEIFTRMNGNI